MPTDSEDSPVSKRHSRLPRAYSYLMPWWMARKEGEGLLERNCSPSIDTDGAILKPIYCFISLCLLQSPFTMHFVLFIKHHHLLGIFSQSRFEPRQQALEDYCYQLFHLITVLVLQFFSPLNMTSQVQHSRHICSVIPPFLIADILDHDQISETTRQALNKTLKHTARLQSVRATGRAPRSVKLTDANDSGMWLAPLNIL